MMLHKEELAKVYLEKAEQAIKSSKDSIYMQNYETAQNRIYYAIFYSVMSLAYRNDFMTSKYKQLMGWFNKKFVYEEKIFNKEMSDIYKDTFAKRQKSDYEAIFIICKENLEETLNKAIFFVETVKKYMQKEV